MHAFLYPFVPKSLPDSLDTLHIHSQTSIGIDEVRHLQSFLSRKPTQSQFNLAILHSAHLLTLPAQHALLKTLEEPPGNSQIFLITPFPDQLLPTILSRVQIISSPPIPSNPPDHSFFNQLLSTSKTADRIRLLDDSSFTRESALQFLDDFELILQSQILTGTYNLQPTTYNLILQTRKYLKSNCNLKLTLDNLAINLILPPLQI